MTPSVNTKTVHKLLCIAPTGESVYVKCISGKYDNNYNICADIYCVENIMIKKKMDVIFVPAHNEQVYCRLIIFYFNSR